MDRKLRIALWAVGIFVVCFCFVQSLAFVLACLPVSAHFTLNKPHYCVNRRLAGTIISAFNVASEFVILALPLPALYKMQTPRRQKMGIMGIFMAGGLLVAVIRGNCVIGSNIYSLGSVSPVYTDL